MLGPMCFIASILLVLPSSQAQETVGDAVDFAQVFSDEIVPILEQHCYDCHGYGTAEGNFVIDEFASPQAAMEATDTWWRVVKNLRAGVMPPAEASTLSEEELETIYRWVKFGPFQIDPQNIDPGPVTIRRLNRTEYGNTIRQLMDVPFDEQLLFPPDDSGHGFDNVADALMVSPLLLDKYFQAAETVVNRAVPQQTWIVPRQDFDGGAFVSREPDGPPKSGRWLDGKQAASVAKTFTIDESGRYDVMIAIKQHGSFEFDPARYNVTCAIDGQQRFDLELGWDEHKRTEFQYEEDWTAGEHQIEFRLTPVVEEGEDAEAAMERNQNTSVHFQIDAVSLAGPQGTSRRVHPRNYHRFFTQDEPPVAANAKEAYAREVLERFATRAFRGRVDAVTVERLVGIASAEYSQPDKTFEYGISRAMIAALVSPNFLFRIEATESGHEGAPFAPVDELSLASRLSYFLWSSMPDEELFELAEAGQLREKLVEQVDRMLADPKAEAFVTNFVGQWLRTRDVANVAVDPAVVLGFADELEELRAWFRSRPRRGRGEMSDEAREKFARFREIQSTLERFDAELKRAVQRETEMLVEHIVRSEASLLDLLDCDYTFLNEKLAAHYGIPGVEGREMRLVRLPEDSPRGGVLTHASMLMVTSNPTRTSPVKRGLFILDNILGTPAPPAPGAVPELEASADRFEGREPTLRELLEVHRESKLCASCHARMDPLGLALENFDALGMWREQDGDARIDPQGQLVTGETFEDIRSLKSLLRESHADDFYRCVSEKLLVFAIGRGVEQSDEHTIDQIVEELRRNDGKFRSLLQAVIESAPFQKQRTTAVRLSAVGN